LSVSRQEPAPTLSGFRRLLNRLFGREEGSGDEARQRLQLVLIQDRSSLSAASLDAIKDEIIRVVSKYLVVDRDSIWVEVKRSSDAVMLVSNMRITQVR